jgi:hypothetical protein
MKKTAFILSAALFAVAVSAVVYYGTRIVRDMYKGSPDTGLWSCGEDGGEPCSFTMGDAQTEWEIRFNEAVDGGGYASYPIAKYLFDKHELRVEYADGGTCSCPVNGGDK